MRLLHRTASAGASAGAGASASAGALLDGTAPTLKCGVSYGVALALARELRVPLNDLMWDPA